MRALSLLVMLVACGDPEAGPASFTPLPDGGAADAGPRADAVAPPLDATPLDGAPRDAEALADAAGAAADGGPDAASPDGAVDAAEDAAVDAAPSPDAGGFGPCVANGQPGECLDVGDCAGVPVPGFCPGPAEIQCCVAAPMGCDPDARPAGPLDEAPGDAGCPPGMAAVGGFCVDRYEAALVQADGMPWSPYQWPGVADVRAVSVAGVVPQGYIDGVEAAAACAASGKRLCTDEEWLRACQGADGHTWPWGDDRRPGTCNDARAQHPAVELFPDDPNPFSHLQDPCLNQLPASLAATGAHPGCVTPEGVFDLVGNLHEWTADPAGTFRGGFYVDTERNGPGCTYRTTAHDRPYWDYSTGFRCCADALP